MQKKYQIMPAKEEEFSLIVRKLDAYFNQNSGYFENLVPTLYKEGMNSFRDHLVVKDQNEIIGIVAAKKKKIYIEDKEYVGILIGSLSVDPKYRNQGIMSMILNYIDDSFKEEVDFFALSGNYDRYHRFGFDYSAKIDNYLYEPKVVSNGFELKKIDNFDFEFCQKLYMQNNYRIERNDIIDNLKMWENEAYIVTLNGKSFGYFVFNHKNSVVEEICLEDDYKINEVMHFVAGEFQQSIGLKISLHNQKYLDIINSNSEKCEFIERTLYKINNQNLEEVYIPRCDLI